MYKAKDFSRVKWTMIIVRPRFEILAQGVNGLRLKKPKTMNFQRMG